MLPLFKRFRRTVIALVSVTLLLVLLPEMLRFGALYWLRHNLTPSAQLRDIDLNLLSGRFALLGLQLPLHGAEPLALQRLAFEWRWWPLWRGRAEVVAIELEGVRVALQRDSEGGYAIPGLRLPEREPEPQLVVSTEPTPPATLEWRVGGVLLRDIQLQLTAADGSLAPLQMAVVQLSLGDLSSWLPSQTTPLQASLSLGRGQVILDGAITPLDEAPSAQLSIAIEGLELADTHLLLPDGGVAPIGVVDAHWQLQLHTLGPSLQLLHDGQLQLSGVKVSLAAAEMAFDSLSWHGNGEVTQVAAQLPVAKLAGTLTLSGVGWRQDAPEQRVTLGSLSWQGEMESTPQSPLLISGPLQLSQLVLDVPTPPAHLSLQGLKVGGYVAADSQVWLGLSGWGETLQVSAPLQLQLDTLVAQATPYQVELQGLEWRGHSIVTPQPSLFAKINGDLLLSELAIRETVQSLTLLQFQQIEVNGIEAITPEPLQIAHINLNQLKLLPTTAPQNSLLTLGDATLTQLHYSPMTTTLEGLDLRDLTLSVSKNKQGEFEHIAALQTAQPDPQPDPQERTHTAASDVEKPMQGEGGTTESETKAEPAMSPMAMRLHRLTLSGQNTIYYRDASLTPPLEIAPKIVRLDLTGIDSGDPQQPLTYLLEAQPAPYATLKSEGVLYPFMDQPTVVTTTTIKGLDLPPYSSFTIPQIGYAFSSGHLDTDSQFSLLQGVVASSNHITLRRMELEPVDEQAMDRFSRQLTMPLNVALSTLKDDSGDIELNIPIEGPLDEISVGVSDVVNTALGKAMRYGALFYLKQALQPYGTLISVVQMAGEAIARIRLDPVSFEAGSHTIEATASDYLAQTQTIMLKRPDLRLRLCGVAVPADEEALLAQLIAQQPSPKQGSSTSDTPTITKGEAGAVSPPPVAPPAPQLPEGRMAQLASARAEAVKQLLVTQHHIAADRLFVCQPEVRRDAPEDAPVVELLI